MEQSCFFNHNRNFILDPISKDYCLFITMRLKIRNLEKEFNFTKTLMIDFLQSIETEDFNRAINEIKLINLTSFSSS